MLTVSLLILLSVGAIGLGLKLLYNTQQSAQTTPQDMRGETVARIGVLALTSNGYVVSSPDYESLPELTLYTDPLFPGDKIQGEEVLKTGQLLLLFKKNDIAVVSATIYTKDYCVLTLPETIRVLYNDKSDVRTLTSSLQSMMAVFTIEGTKPEEIDFRYDKPVIRY